MEGKQTRGRQKIAIKRIENEDDRLITFSKRRSGIYKKASELVTLCGAEVAVLVLSPAGKAFSFGHPSIESVANRFLGQNIAPNDNTHPLVEAHRKVRINDLNQQHNELLSEMEAERDRGKLLKEGTSGKSGQGWWEAPIDELSLQELKQMSVMLEEFHKNLHKKINELRRNGGASSSSFQAHTGHATNNNIPFCQL
ncbi:agamous-like MADS-box protein AGL62 [Populus alba x Populus x berolinensis]|nr:agamous-like MADS-box protein AGL62 [Populus alba x Populus x berolinensis]